MASTLNVESRVRRLIVASQDTGKLRSRRAAEQLIALARSDRSAADALVSELRGDMDKLDRIVGHAQEPVEVLRNATAIPSCIRDISAKSRLIQETEVAGGLQRKVKDMLLVLGVETYYEALRFKVGQSIFVPPFLVGMGIGGRPILLNTCGERHITDRYLRKASGFASRWGSDFFSVAVSNTGETPESARRGIALSKTFDEYWPTDRLWERFRDLRKRPDAKVYDLSRLIVEGNGE